MKEVRIHFQLQGRLQGVGFRPFIYRLAQELDLAGWVKNTAQGVEIELQGHDEVIRKFESRLIDELPSIAQIRSLKKDPISLENIETHSYKNGERFQILFSESHGIPNADILPDLAVCKSCLNEVLNPQDRRYRYPFTSCTDCGPRYSILRKLPYDRENTTMSPFQMCQRCLQEYHNPLDRRFHAQTSCCEDCGPFLALKDADGKVLAEKDAALKDSAEAIQKGIILAVQGIGGFHLFCDAGNDAVVRRLREVKKRNSKPFAVMVQDLSQAHELCRISKLEESLLQGKGAPIVLLRKKPAPPFKLSPLIAPGISILGVMLPYTPLHALLMSELQGPVVATSGNISEEPICFDPAEALVRLKGIADCFLVHNRPIASRIDDSVVREIAGTEVVMRAGRGYAPLVVGKVSFSTRGGSNPKKTLIALGGHQKNTIGLAHEERILLMPHIGNLDTEEATHAYEQTLQSVMRLHGIESSYDHPVQNSENPEKPVKNPIQNPIQTISDLHPHYRTTLIGQSLDPSLIQVQHHEAHLLSCVAEHQLQGEIFGVAWDGTGYGLDGSIWGGEFFRGTERGFLRTGSFRPFRLWGGSTAVRETRRTALGILYEIFGENCFEKAQTLGFGERELQIGIKALSQNLNSPVTSSVGRLFDGIAALAGLRSYSDYEGQAALELESSLHDSVDSFLTHSSVIHSTGNLNTESDIKNYPIRIKEESLLLVDWEPWILEILKDRKQGLSIGRIAAKFHRTLAETIVKMALHFRIPQVVLSGGCFQNQVLSEWTISALKKEGFKPYWNQKIPPNDGGISVGQVIGGWNVSVCTSSSGSSFG